VALRDSRSDLAHDLLDIDVLAVLARALLLSLRRCGPAPLVAAPVLASPAMKVLTAAVLWILICHLFKQCSMPNDQCPTSGTRVVHRRLALAIQHSALCLVQ
jgi:hypothetical protein